MTSINRPRIEELANDMSIKTPLFGRIVQQLSEHSQVQHGLSVMATLSAASVVAQDLYDVESPTGARRPICIATVGLLDSGGGKSSAFSRVLRPISAAQKVSSIKHHQELLDYNAARSVWQIEKRAIERLVRNSAAETDEYDEAIAMLSDVVSAEPKKPVLDQLIFEDVSPAALFAAMSEQGSGAVVSAEGSVFLNGKALDSYGHLNSILSSEDVVINRAGKEPVRIYDPRMTLSIAIQPAVFDRLPGKRKEELRESGFWARCIVFRLESLAGTRDFTDRAKSSESLEQFDDRMVELLEQRHERLRGNDKKRKLLKLDAEARSAWFGLSSRIEELMRVGEMYEHARDHASKLGENVLRLAAVIHVIEGLEGEISKPVLEVAMDIAEACSNDFMEVFVPPPQELTDADSLYEYLMSRYRERGIRFVSRAYARQCAPNAQRVDGRFYRALDVLVSSGQLAIVNNEKGKEFIDVFPEMALPQQSLPPGKYKFPVLGK